MCERKMNIILVALFFFVMSSVTAPPPRKEEGRIDFLVDFSLLFFKETFFFAFYYL